eukprot:GILJ01001986.1.p1 GENE.GILJ01001986.1~~GILJ01001986.1.p1  ORF type:complete len:223 (-),score=33.08 GILJ01001986.1:160-828(-)
MADRVVHIQSDQEWVRNFKAGGDKLIVAQFSAEWCGPCKGIAPAVQALSKEYPQVSFLHIDVDKCQDTAQEFSVRSIPTFLFFKKGAKIDEMTGAKEAELKAKVAQHAPPGAFHGVGYSLSGSASAPVAAPATQVDAGERPQVDESRPTTTIQFRLHNGTRVSVKYNQTHTVGDLHTFVLTAAPLDSDYQLTAGFPPKPLTDSSLSLKDAGLLDSVVTQKRL